MDYESFPKKVVIDLSLNLDKILICNIESMIENHKHSDAVKYMDENIKEIGEYKRIYAYCIQADGWTVLLQKCLLILRILFGNS